MLPINTDAQSVAKIHQIGMTVAFHIKGAFDFKGKMFFLGRAVKAFADKHVGFGQSAHDFRDLIDDIHKTLVNMSFAVGILIMFIDGNDLPVVLK